MGDYWEEENFDHYEPTTIDPGWWLFGATCIFCMTLLAILCYMFARTYKMRKQVEAQRISVAGYEDGVDMKKKADEASVGTNSTEDASSDDDSIATEVEDDADSVTSTTVPIVDAMLACGGGVEEQSMTATVMPKKNTRKFLRGNKMKRFMGLRGDVRRHQNVVRHKNGMSIVFVDTANVSVPAYIRMAEPNVAVVAETSLAEKDNTKSTDYLEMEEQTNIESDELNSKENQQTKGSKSRNLFRVVKSFWRKLRRVATYDNEMKKILKLTIPYTLTALSWALNEIFTLVVIGNVLGTQALSAVIAVDFALSISTAWLQGPMSSLTSLCSQAIGTGNLKLAGEYVQIAVLISQFLYIPQLILWLFFIDDFILWLGFNEQTAKMGYSYAVVVLFRGLFGYVSSGLHSLLEVNGHEEITAIATVLQSIVESVTILSVAISFHPSLWTVGVIFFAIDVIVFIGLIIFVRRKGILDDYITGLVGVPAWRNRDAVKLLVQTGVPLSISSILSSGEWQILSLLAKFLGPAEFVAFGVFGELWSCVEGLTYSLGYAGEVRCSYLLGNNKPMRAKQSAQKCLFLGVADGLLKAVFFAACGSHFASWMTNDTTIQNMLTELIPFLCLGVVFDTFGSISFALVGAQGCFELSTVIYFIGSWFVTLPMALIFSLIGINLQGLVASVIVGNALSGLVNTFMLFDADWHYFADLTRARNKADEVCVLD